MLALVRGSPRAGANVLPQALASRPGALTAAPGRVVRNRRERQLDRAGFFAVTGLRERGGLATGGISGC